MLAIPALAKTSGGFTLILISETKTKKLSNTVYKLIGQYIKR